MDLNDVKWGRHLSSGSFGAVHFGVWMGKAVAVKSINVCTTSEDTKVRVLLIAMSQW